MADIGPSDIWPELDGRRTASVAQTVYWTRSSTDQYYRVATSSSAATHYSVTLSTVLGIQPYPGSSSVMALKGKKSVLLQLQTDTADPTFFYWSDVWLSTDGSGAAVLAASSSDLALYFANSSDVSSTASASTATGSTDTTVQLWSVMHLGRPAWGALGGGGVELGDRLMMSGLYSGYAPSSAASDPAGAFVLSTANASTTVYIGTQQPTSMQGVRIWEAE